jgi:hypothetical protein
MHARKSARILAAGVITWIGLAAVEASAELTVWQVDSMTKVFEDAEPPEQPQPVLVEAARNEVVSAQFCVRSSAEIKGLSCAVAPLTSPGGGEIESVRVRFVGFIPCNRNSCSKVERCIRPAPARFPDPLLEEKKRDVAKDTTQPVWITVHVPKKAVPGTYEGNVLFATENGETATSSLAVKVYDALLPDKRTLTVSMWSPLGTTEIEPWEPRTAEYWEILRAYARNMSAHRLTGSGTSKSCFSFIRVKRNDAGEITFDFTDFDRWMKVFLDEGLTAMEGGPLGYGRWARSNHRSVIWKVEGDGLTMKKVGSFTQEHYDFLAKFLPALQAHLQARGWLDNYYQHIFDEPMSSERYPPNYRCYIELSSVVKRHAPKLIRMDAIHHFASVDHLEKMVGNVDIWCPQLPFLAPRYDRGRYEFFKSRQKQGEALWFYTVGSKYGGIARMIDLHALETRYLHWLSFRYGVTGYLHWGWNFWKNRSGVAGQYGEYRGDMGNGHIVYPRKDGMGVLDSIRYEAEMEGIQDYELFKRLEATAPAKATSLVQTMVTSQTEYSLDLGEFRSVRRALLTALSETPCEPMVPAEEDVPVEGSRGEAGQFFGGQGANP